MRYVLGIDIGGTNLVVGCVAEDGSAMHGLATAPTQAEALATIRLRATASGCSQPGPGPISPSLILART